MKKNGARTNGYLLLKNKSIHWRNNLYKIKWKCIKDPHVKHKAIELSKDNTE